MRTAIVGDGIGGRTLYRLLKRRGVQVELYGQEKSTKCGIRPCGFGTSGFCVHLMEKLGISPEEHVLCHADYITMNGRKIQGDIYGIDKPKLLEAIAIDIRYDKPDVDGYDLLVDATGMARGCSQQIPRHEDRMAINYQHRVILKNDALPAFDIIRGGYLWTIPLCEKEAHVGGGSIVLTPSEIEQLVLRRVEQIKPNEIVCSCSEPLRLSGPLFPVVSGKVVAIGEAAGLVVPFGGAGIHTAIESAIILADLIEKGDISGYAYAIRKRFGWLCDARKILDSLVKGQASFFSLGIAYRALCYQGLKPTVMDLLHIRRNLLEANTSEP
jgi:flavin-dependent dehydrogenase